MITYKIDISYRTGNSFGSEDIIDAIELTWNDVNVAKENLKRIQEHYEMYRNLNSYSSKLSKDELFKQNKDKEWFVNRPKLYCISSNCAIEEKDKKKVGDNNWEYRPDSYFAEYCLNLKTDDDKNLQLRAFWCGHFESLYEATIEMDKSDMKISFR